MNILIVDDSKAMRMIVRRTLRQAGFGKHETHQAGDGKEALHIMAQNRIDLVLSDWNMPNMNGLQLLQFLRSRGSRVRFGFVTTEGTPDMRARAIAAGAQFVIVKPFTAQTFEATLTTLFHGGQQVEVQHNAPIAEGTNMGGILLPTPKAVATLFHGVLDRAVEAVPWRSPPPLSSPLAAAVYQSDEKGQEAACLIDLTLAAYGAGAINLMHPSTITQELKKGGALPQQLQDSIHEMFNLVARIFNAPAGRRIKLVSASVSPAPVLGEVLPFLEEDFASASHMVLNIPGFGRGKLSVFVKKD